MLNLLFLINAVSSYQTRGNFIFYHPPVYKGNGDFNRARILSGVQRNVFLWALKTTGQKVIF